MKIANDIYNKELNNFIKLIKDKIKKEVSKGNCKVGNTYKGTIQFSSDDTWLKFSYASIPYTTPKDYQWYSIIDHGDRSKIHILGKTYEKMHKNKAFSDRIDEWFELTPLGEKVYYDVIRICKSEGIELEFYFDGCGKTSVYRTTWNVNYNRIHFNQKVTTKREYIIDWYLKADFTVR